MSHATETATLSPEAADHALLNYQREIDTPTLNNILINVQLERLVWLRSKEVQHDVPAPSIDSTVRSVDALLRRRERIELKQAQSADASDEAGMTLTDDDFRDLVRVYLKYSAEVPEDDEDADEAAMRQAFDEVLGPSLADEVRNRYRTADGARPAVAPSPTRDAQSSKAPATLVLDGEASLPTTDSTATVVSSSVEKGADKLEQPAAQNEQSAHEGVPGRPRCPGCTRQRLDRQDRRRLGGHRA